MRGTKVIQALAGLAGLGICGAAHAIEWYFREPGSKLSADIDWLHQLVMWLIIAIFKRLLNVSEQFLYTVDEWLRFRKGESRLAFYLKMYAGVVWFFVTYIFRIVINLMVEPTINPIKHFPVVTVAAKLLLPFAEVLRVQISHATSPFIGVVLANLLALSLIFFIPGLAGFLVWELKENWRL